MFKTIITFAALATLAATSIAPAHAFRLMNGAGDNGWSNGGTENGWTNGGTENGWSNGGTENGWSNGGGNNGAASGSSTLTILAIELPPETR